MDNSFLTQLYALEGRVAVITGGSGVLLSAIARGFARAGAKIALLNRTPANAEDIAVQIQAAGGEAAAFACDVTSREQLEAACAAVLARFGRVDILVNGAGGNMPEAITAPGQPFFDIPAQALGWVTDLNLLGTILPCQVFGAEMARQASGVILNITSMSAYRPLTRGVAYAAAKAAVGNFTSWLAVHLAQEYSPNIRVNALAPGFFLGKQNRALLVDPQTGRPTPRGEAVLAHTPAGRFGSPDDLVGTALWLVSPASAFVTGVAVPVDGGFNAFGGV